MRVVAASSTGKSSEDAPSQLVDVVEEDQSPGRNGSGPVAPTEDPGWLEQPVQLAGGYRTTRRDLLKFLSLGAALGSLGIVFTRAKAMSFASPKAVLAALFPREDVTRSAAGAENRVPAFKRFIADVERRGGGERIVEFPQGSTWFNAPPLKLARELRGKVVLLDFWTYCCINCMHVLPELAALERAYEGQAVAVVGVHSAKFDNEKDDEAIRQAVLRYDISHPVINDTDMVMWRSLGVSSWPTVAVVSPKGGLLAMLPGEGHKQDLDDFIAAALEYYAETEPGLLDASPPPQALEKDRTAPPVATPLRFPGKLAVDARQGRLFIADSNNHRVVVTDLSGRCIAVVGSGGAGLQDGTFEDAAFNRPQGLAWDDARQRLYVADTENHALRVVRFEDGTVATLAGNGLKGSDYAGGASGGSQQLNSPWDVAMSASGNELFIAMAGQHQIWKCDVESGVCSAFSGNGYERSQNGSSGLNTSWAQPSGLALSVDGRSLYVADAESSSLRVMDTATGGSRRIAGGDPLMADNLFLFGDRDGAAGGALMQHPLAVAVAPGGAVLVCDSYNHRVKRYDPAAGTLTSVAGCGTAGLRDGAARDSAFSEPGGLAFAPDGALLVADTNNSVIRRVDLSSGRVSTLDIVDVPAPRAATRASAPAQEVPPGAKLVVAAPLEGRSGQIDLVVRLPDGYHFTPGANSSWTALAPPSLRLTPASGVLVEGGDKPAMTLRFEAEDDAAGVARLQIIAKVYFCRDSDVCLLEEVAIVVPITLSGGALPAPARVTHTVRASAPQVMFPV